MSFQACGAATAHQRQNSPTSPHPALSSRELAELVRLSRSQRAPRRLVERARVVLCVEQGQSIRSLTKLSGQSKNTVRTWRDRFRSRRAQEPDNPVADYLCDEDREGRPPQFSAEQVVQLMSLATADPQTEAVPHSHWSCRELARVAVESGRFEHLSKSHVQRLLNQDQLKPHKSQMWLGRKDDPDYDERANRVTKLCCEATQSQPQDAAGPQTAGAATQKEAKHALLSFDEKTSIQALERIAPDRPMRKGMPVKLEYEYRRHGTLTLHGLMQVNSGRVNGFCLPQRTNDDTVMTMRMLVGLVMMEGYEGVTVILDQLNTHLSLDMVRTIAELCGIEVPDEKELDSKHKRRAFLEAEGHRVRFQFTPRHASWLNPIEKWFSVLVRRLLRRASFCSTEQLGSRILEFIDYYNRHLAHPYRYRRRTYGKKSAATG
jgi:transposase